MRKRRRAALSAGGRWSPLTGVRSGGSNDAEFTPAEGAGTARTMLGRGLFAQGDAYVYLGASLAATHIARPVSCDRRSAATRRVERMAGSGAKLVRAALMAVVLLPAQAGAAVRYPGNGSWQPGASSFGEGVLKDQALVTDDGVRLSA